MAEFGETLSKRELDVLRCTADGSSNKEIAAELFISANTVKVHLRNIYAKLGVSSRTEATKVAIQQGVIEGHIESQADEAVEEIAETAEAPLVIEESVAPQETTPDPPPPIPDSSPNHWRLYAIVGALAGMMAIIAILAIQQQSAQQADAATAIPPTAVSFTNTPIGDTAWAHSRPLPQGKAQMAAAVIGLDIYLIGGDTGSESGEPQVSGDVQRFDNDTKVWSAVAEKPTAVSDATAATLFGEIYVPGGKLANGELTAVVEAYSPANDAWRPVASLPEPLSGGLTLSDGSYLYHIGGWNGDGYVDTVYLYDAATDNWRPLPSMNYARAFTAGAQMAGRLFVVGGYDGENALATCELFSTVEEKWTACADMLLPRMNWGGTAVLNKLYIIGGETEEDGHPAFAEQYDPNTDTWQIVNIPAETNGIGLRGNGVIHVETKIYSIGGQHGNSIITDTLIYTPIVYQTFIPAAAAGGSGE